VSEVEGEESAAVALAFIVIDDEQTHLIDDGQIHLRSSIPSSS
jgi:hypothetical protein